MRILLLLAFLSVSGCGTFINTVGYGPIPYGGVVQDCEIIDRHAKDGGIAMIIDLPLSFAADTAMLPISIPCRLSGASGRH